MVTQRRNTLGGLGVRTDFQMDVDLPPLSPAGKRRVRANVQKRALPRARRQIITPAKRNFGKRSGLLRRKMRAARVRNRSNENVYFTVILMKFIFYTYFQEEDWDKLRDIILDEATPIVVESVAAAIQDELDGMVF